MNVHNNNDNDNDNDNNNNNDNDNIIIINRVRFGRWKMSRHTFLPLLF